jgi:hypothetical protein
MRGHGGVAAMADQELYLSEYDGIEALRRSLLAALVKKRQYYKGVTPTNARNATESARRSSAEAPNWISKNVCSPLRRARQRLLRLVPSEPAAYHPGDRSSDGPTQHPASRHVGHVMRPDIHARKPDRDDERPADPA